MARCRSSSTSTRCWAWARAGRGPQTGDDWREQPVQFDRRGALDTMEPRWQSDMYGSRNPVAMLLGTGGWGLFVATPWVQVDLRDANRGVFLPFKPTGKESAPQNERNQQQSARQGRFRRSIRSCRALRRVRLRRARPGRRAEGLLGHHRAGGRCRRSGRSATCSRTARSRTTGRCSASSTRSGRSRFPLDAVIYLGTGFAPRGWNTRQPSFDFNPEVFKRDPKAVLADMHARNVKVVVHMVPWDRDQLPTLHGTSRRSRARRVDASHIQTYWQQHVPLVTAGVDAFWPDEGDWFNLFERIKRHQLYYQGPLSTQPNVRPWSLQRNGYPGIAQWGGWVWSGDTESSWKTLEAQIAVGLNYSLSIGPYWGSDIGGFYPNSELTGELYARWFQFAAFCGSFRSHGRDVVDAPAVGLGAERHGAARVQQHERADSARRPAQHPAVGDEQPGDRAGREEVRRAALSADAVHLHAGVGGARRGPAADARDVAALSGRRRAPGVWAISSCGAATC